MQSPDAINKNVELVVPPHKFGEFSELVESFQIESHLLVSDLQE